MERKHVEVLARLGFAAFRQKTGTKAEWNDLPALVKEGWMDAIATAASVTPASEILKPTCSDCGKDLVCRSCSPKGANALRTRAKKTAKVAGGAE